MEICFKMCFGCSKEHINWFRNKSIFFDFSHFENLLVSYIFQSANNKTGPGRVESAGNKSVKLGRKELFDESALPDHYPLHHVKVCCHLIF